MKFFTKEVKIALAAILGILVLYFGMNFLKGMTPFSNDSTYCVKFKDISGLSASSPILANGYQVGVVTGISYDYATNGGAVVRFDVDKALSIPRGSTAEIESDMMGNVKMNLILGDNAAVFLQPGDTITGSVNGGAMGKLAEMVPAVERMLPKLDSIMASLNTLLADPAIVQSLHNVRDVTSGLTTSTQQLNQLLAGLNRQMPAMMTKADGTLDNVQQITANLAAVDVAATMAKVDQTIENVQTITAQLNSSEGTLGLLMRDPTLYRNLSNTMGSADSLLIDLRQHPKRYVHFSLFGRKDK